MTIFEVGLLVTKLSPPSPSVSMPYCGLEDCGLNSTWSTATEMMNRCGSVEVDGKFTVSCVLASSYDCSQRQPSYFHPRNMFLLLQFRGQKFRSLLHHWGGGRDMGFRPRFGERDPRAPVINSNTNKTGLIGTKSSGCYIVPQVFFSVYSHQAWQHFFWRPY